jgi:hypothetical protein
MKFCFESNIILCQLGSHTSHKTQPCDVGPFGPLKTAYREQAERLFRGGANMIGKQHFILLYDRARTAASTPRNINWESLTCLRTKIEQGSALDSLTTNHFQKLANASEKAFADHTILLDENRLLFEQNNEKTTRQSVKSTMPGNARIMTYDDMVKAEEKQRSRCTRCETRRSASSELEAW